MEALGALKRIAEWLVSVSEWFEGWDTATLIPALIVLGVLAGVTGRAAVAPRLRQQILWGSATAFLGLVEAAVIWTLVARYLPVADLGTFIQNMIQHKPLLAI